MVIVGSAVVNSLPSLTAFVWIDVPVIGGTGRGTSSEPDGGRFSFHF